MKNTLLITGEPGNYTIVKTVFDGIRKAAYNNGKIALVCKIFFFLCENMAENERCG